MPKPSIVPKCEKCASSLSLPDRYCPSCKTDVGFPNVRECSQVDELKALRKRYTDAREKAVAKGYLKPFRYAERKIKKSAGVVVCMSPLMAINLINDPKHHYVGYEKLVESGARVAASPDDDRQRSSVGGKLFGAYAKEIVYGALSLRTTGVTTYGSASCRLKDIFIEERTTFLESNSYGFYARLAKAPQRIPAGLRASWSNRHELALAKLGKKVAQVTNIDSLQAMLLRTDGQSRYNDDYIEAHIFGGFDLKALEEISLTPSAPDPVTTSTELTLKYLCQHEGIRCQ